MLLPALLVAGLTPAAAASPTILTDQEMGRIAAGSTLSLSLADGAVLNVAVNRSNLQVTGDIAALKMATVVINGTAIDLQGKPLDTTIPAAPVVVTLSSNAALSAPGASSVAMNVSTSSLSTGMITISGNGSSSSALASGTTATTSIYITASSAVVLSR